MKTINQKLSLNKKTIANLNFAEMKSSRAGNATGIKAEPTIFDRSCPIHCPTTTRQVANESAFITCRLSIAIFCPTGILFCH